MRGCSTAISAGHGSRSTDAASRSTHAVRCRRGPMSLLTVTDLHSGYGPNEVIHGIDFSVDTGQIVTILGPNGCGKSTFVRTLLGYVRARRGNVVFDGDDIT